MKHSGFEEKWGFRKQNEDFNDFTTNVTEHGGFLDQNADLGLGQHQYKYVYLGNVGFTQLRAAEDGLQMNPWSYQAVVDFFGLRPYLSVTRRSCGGRL